MLCTAVKFTVGLGFAFRMSKLLYHPLCSYKQISTEAGHVSSAGLPQSTLKKQVSVIVLRESDIIFQSESVTAQIA